MATFNSDRTFFARFATAIAISTVSLLVIIALFLFLQQGRAAEQANALVERTFEVRGHIRLLISAIKDAEIGQRDFLVTGNEGDLQPYSEALRDSPSADAVPTSSAARRSIQQELAVLRRMTTNNLAQQSNLDEMDDIVTRLLDYLARTIETRRSQPAGAVPHAADIHSDKEMMDQVRSLGRIMDAEETHLLALRSEAEGNSAQQSQFMTFSALAIFYISLCTAIWLYQRNQTRARAAAQLYTTELEHREEELKAQQEELKTFNEEIRTTNEELEESSRALEEQNAQIQQQSEELAESQRLTQEKADELERASRYKSEFLANMSHELRTPLNSLLILARMLAANEEGNLTEEQIEEANVIHNGGLELLTLINDILDLSKVEAGKLTAIAEEVTLASIVGRVAQQFGPVARETGLDFPVHIADDLPGELHTDGQRIEQILKNLLANAFKFTERGSVTLSVSRPDATDLPMSGVPDESVAFAVTDTGIGIDPVKFKDIFEAFRQENGSIDRHYGGTGLGLTIARKFAHLLGGEIRVRSAKGSGSTFTLVVPVRLPRSEADAERDANADLVPARSRIELKAMPRSQVTEFIADDRHSIATGDKVLLIIEDDPAFSKVLMRMARKRGYKCVAAGDGKSGLVLALELGVTAIILDIRLPDIDGVRVLEQLKHDLRTRHIPVHVISGTDGVSALATLRKGAIGHLTKPARPETLESVFNRIEALLSADAKHILVVEDDENTQVAVRSLLRKKDVEITIAGTGAAALAHINQTRFDCIILDLQLPDTTGLAWLENLERQTERPIPPVIVYTASELSEDENREINRYTGNIIIKGARSPERLLDEVTLFLHSVEATLSEEQQNIIRLQHDPDQMLQGRTLLLVDDDLRNIFALSKLLKGHGLNIVIADNGQMALDKLAQDRAIELVIMDVMMPVMDGYQAMSAIRARPELAGLPIIALTARAMLEEQEKCMAAGASDYLTKPVDIERLLTLLRVLLFRQEMAA